VKSITAAGTCKARNTGKKFSFQVFDDLVLMVTDDDAIIMNQDEFTTFFTLLSMRSIKVNTKLIQKGIYT